MNKLLISLTFLIAPCLIYAEDPKFSFEKTTDGIVLYPKEDDGSHVAYMQIKVVTDKIIRIISVPEKNISPSKSLMLMYTTNSLPAWSVQESANNVQVKTNFVTVNANLVSGVISYLDAVGKLIVNEKENSRSLTPVIYEGKQSYRVNQTFDLSADDALYGLGQHQDGLMNYKGYQVLLFQNNTEVAVPMLVSSKHYGILWDNNAITKAGDTRNYLPISKMQLYSAKGETGWLTASYFNDKNKDEVSIERAESEINMEYLTDSKIKLPADFKIGKGKVVWQGSIASDVEGIYKLRFLYGGYLKVWIDDELVLDRWRQCWNPGSAIIDCKMKKDLKHTLKMEWIPDGEESYIGLKFLPPIDPESINSFGFESEAGQCQDYYFIYGTNIDDVISGYRTLTGKATMLPLWTFGFWQSRERYKTQDEILNTVKEFRSRKIPLDNIVLDWSYWKEDAWGSQEFDASRFPNADSMIKVLHEKYKTHFMISVWPKFYEGISSYNEFDKNGWLYKRNIADRQRDWIGKGYVSTFYDAFNPGARKGFWNLLNNKLYSKGVDAWWMDASEPDILSNVSPEKRKDQMYPLYGGITAENLNAYPLENARGIYEGQRETDSSKRVFILTRSAFAGMQRYAAATWSGDISANWHDMKLQIAAGVNFSLSGMPYWTMDAGGFAVQKRFEKPNDADLEEWRELMTRWYQFGAFVPLFRVHGQFPFREIYNVSPETHTAYQSMLFYNRLRYRLMPYIYSLAGRTYVNDYTIMRGLVMDFADDEKARTITDQFMFGPSLLINPVCNYRDRIRSLYLPAGNGWYNLYTGEYQEGGHRITAEAAYERMPVFVKAGAIIPFGPALQYTTEKKADTITLNVYAGKDGSFVLYEDEGINYNYEKGAYSTIQMDYSESNGELTIDGRKGFFNGMLKKRYFRIKYFMVQKPVELDLDNAQGKLVTYNGKKLTIQLK